MSGTCETCVHWQQPWGQVHEGAESYDAEAQPWNDGSPWGVCSFIRHPGRGNYTAEEAERYGWKPPPGPPSQRAFTADGSDYLSELSTRADFGCIEHASGEPR